jgi:hypothetical protein
MEAFATLGYRPCAHENYEVGFQKVALYTDVFLSPKHMARQTIWGTWLSKCGDAEDIMHATLWQMDSAGPHPIAHYGKAVAFMKRSWLTAYRVRRERKKRIATP